MNTFKKTVLMCTSVAVSALLLHSCNKTVTPKKLDGEWDVTSGTIATSSSYTVDGTTTTTTTNSTFNGSTLSTTYTQGNLTTTVTSQMSINLTFDKKSGEYTRVTTMTDPEYQTTTGTYYEKDANGNYIPSGGYERTTKRVSTTTETGLFTISGNAGDEIEKNSQIVFQVNKEVENYSDTYTYVVDGTDTDLDPAGKYEAVWGSSGISYVALETADSGTETETGSDPYSEVWNVTELKKGEMDVEYTNSTQYSSSEDDNTSSYSSVHNYTLTQK